MRESNYYDQQDQAAEVIPMFAYQYRIMTLCFQPKILVKVRYDLITSVHLHEESQLAPRELALSVIEDQKADLPSSMHPVRAPAAGLYIPD